MVFTPCSSRNGYGFQWFVVEDTASIYHGYGQTTTGSSCQWWAKQSARIDVPWCSIHNRLGKYRGMLLSWCLRLHNAFIILFLFGFSWVNHRFMWLLKLIAFQPAKSCSERALARTLEQKLTGDFSRDFLLANFELPVETNIDNNIWSHWSHINRTPLHLAVFSGHEEIVRLLLQHKCDVNAKDMVNCLNYSPAILAIDDGLIIYRNIPA